MTLPRLNAMVTYWEDSPPTAHSINEVRQIMRAYFKIPDNRKRKREESKEMSEEEFREQFLNFGRLAGMC